ncbi:MAG: hypothetical protein HEQ32_08880 [Vampirovibrio sp.]
MPFPSFQSPYGASANPIYNGFNSFASAPAVDESWNTPYYPNGLRPYYPTAAYAGGLLPHAPYLSSAYGAATYGVGSYYNLPHALHGRLEDPTVAYYKAQNAVPLAEIDLKRDYLNGQFGERSEIRQLDFSERKDIRGIHADDRSQDRQLAFDNESQKRQLEFLHKTQERSLLGTLLTQLVPPVLQTITHSSNKSSEERMFNRLADSKDKETSSSAKIQALKERIAQLERRSDRSDASDHPRVIYIKSPKRKAASSRSKSTRVIDSAPTTA